MTSVAVNAVIVGIAVWLTSQFWHATGIGLVLSTVAVYVIVRFALGFALMFLSARLGRPHNGLIWS